MKETSKKLPVPEKLKKPGIVKIDEGVESIEIDLAYPHTYKVHGNGKGRKKGEWLLKVTSRGKVILV